MSDADTIAFVDRFLADIAAVSGGGAHPKVARLLARALDGEDAAWRELYHAVGAVECLPETDRARDAAVRLRAFRAENADLAAPAAATACDPYLARDARAAS